MTTAPKVVHIPVLKQVIMDNLKQFKKGDWVLDATLGDAGHSLAFLNAGFKVVSLDFDINSILHVVKNFGRDQKIIVYKYRLKDRLLIPFARNFDEKSKETAKWIIVKSNFAYLDQIVDRLSVLPRAILFDLGISSRQLLKNKRGFSFKYSSKVDMRMDKDEQRVTAYDLLNKLTYKDLRNMFEINVDLNPSVSARLARAIIQKREQKPFGDKDDVKRLNEIAYKIMPIRKRSRGKLHPATLLFLALRISVNQEFTNLSVGLSRAVDVLSKLGGKIFVLSYHSSEHKIIENFANKNRYYYEVIYPTQGEIKRNPRARSARLTIINIVESKQ